MIIKNVSGSTIKFDEFNGITIKPGETTDLSSFSRSERSKSDRLTNCLEKGLIIVVGSGAKQAPLPSMSPNGVPLINIKSSLQISKKTSDSFSKDRQTHLTNQGEGKFKFRYSPLAEEYIEQEKKDRKQQNYLVNKQGTEKPLRPPSHDEFNSPNRFKPITYQQTYINNSQRPEKGDPKIRPHAYSVITPEGFDSIPDFEPGVFDSSRYSDRGKYMRNEQVYKDSGEENYSIPKKAESIDSKKAKSTLPCGAVMRNGKKCTRSPMAGYQWCFNHLPPILKEEYSEKKREDFLNGKERVEKPKKG